MGFDEMKDKAQDMVDKAKDAAGDMVDKVKDAADGAGDKARDLTDDESIEAASEKVKQYAPDGLDDNVDALADKAQTWNDRFEEGKEGPASGMTQR